MEQTSTEERKLESAIEEYIEWTDMMCGAQLLGEEAVAERKLSNVRLAGQVNGLVELLVRCRKQSENFSDYGLKPRDYAFRGTVGSAGMEYSISRPHAQQKAESEGKA